MMEKWLRDGRGHPVVHMKTLTDELNPEQGIGQPDHDSDLTPQAGYNALRDRRYARKAMEAMMKLVGVEPTRRRRKELRGRKWKIWNGRIVWRMICSGCERERWEPEYVAYSVMSLDNYRCAHCVVKGPPRDDGTVDLFSVCPPLTST